MQIGFSRQGFNPKRHLNWAMLFGGLFVLAGAPGIRCDKTAVIICSSDKWIAGGSVIGGPGQIEVNWIGGLFSFGIVCVMPTFKLVLFSPAAAL